MAHLVSRLLEARWPTSETDADQWLDELAGRRRDFPATSSQAHPDFPRADVDLPGWEDARLGWIPARGGIGGVEWLLWSQQEATQIEQYATDLEVELVRLLGPPGEGSGPTPEGAVFVWQLGARRIEFYYFSATFRPSGADTPLPGGVKVHLNLAHVK